MSNIQTFSFGIIPTLSTVYWTSDRLKHSWKWRDRSMESVMQRFIDLNQKNLTYLGISANVETVNGRPAIKLTTSKFIGAIPIMSPMNGKAVGDLVVSGRFGENAGELITLLDSSIKPEYSDVFHLVQDSQMTPPIFIECCKYVDKYLEAERFKWKKFTNQVKIQKQPSGSTLWEEYALRTACNPLDFSTFKNKCNILTTDHPEWSQLNYVLKIAISELESRHAPLRTRSIYSTRIAQLKIRLKNKRMLPTNDIQIRMSDPLVIKQLKELANIILSNKTNEKLAWRMDYAEFFERYVQYLLGDVAKKKGAREIDNPRYGVRVSNRPSWGLSYLEPDLILQKAQEQIVVDAKYKSHIFNWNDNSDELKDTFRHDFHQILAYCSLNSMTTKQAMLVYPFSDFTYHKMTVNSPTTNSEAQVYLVGIPLEKNRMEEVKKELNDIINFN
ncbi:MAG: hypothetical protein IKW93_06170 [Bacteroidales bacterium]|nr:hypothetical protein [Bacteroidales bacterium]